MSDDIFTTLTPTLNIIWTRYFICQYLSYLALNMKIIEQIFSQGSIRLKKKIFSKSGSIVKMHSYSKYLQCFEENERKISSVLITFVMQ